MHCVSCHVKFKRGYLHTYFRLTQVLIDGLQSKDQPRFGLVAEAFPTGLTFHLQCFLQLPPECGHTTQLYAQKTHFR